MIGAQVPADIKAYAGRHDVVFASLAVRQLRPGGQAPRLYVHASRRWSERPLEAAWRLLGGMFGVQLDALGLRLP
jgi:hypothetical protein